MVGRQQLINQYDPEKNYEALSCAFLFTCSFNPDAIAQALLGGTKITFSGSRAVRTSEDVLADYFGLRPDFRSCITVEPRISQAVIDWQWYQSLEIIGSGLYCTLHVPIVHTKWDLHAKEFVNNHGTAFHPAGYMAVDRVTKFATSVEQAMQGATIFGDMREPLRFGKLFDRCTVSHVADVSAMIGWNFLQDDWYHLGCSVRGVAPVGNSPRAEFLFEAIVGNRHHWEFGGAFSAHVDMRESREWK